MNSFDRQIKGSRILQHNGTLLSYTLSNGLQIVAHALPDAQSIGACYYVRSGGHQSIPAGVAHFVEHMLFRSTKTGLLPIQALQRVGAEYNAYTGVDTTVYYAAALSEHFDHVLNVLSEMIFSPSFQQEEFEIEKNVILQEIAADEEEPGCVLFDLMKLACFGKSAFGYPILGTREIIEHIDRSQLYAFWQQHYSPTNMILSVAGKFEEDRLLALAERSCGSSQMDGMRVCDDTSLWPWSRINATVQPLSQQYLLVVLPAIPRDDPDYLAASIGASILEERLYWSILHKGLVENVSAYLWSDSDIVYGTNLLVLEANCLPELAPQVLVQIQSELAKFLCDGITEDELYRKKQMHISGRVLDEEDDIVARAGALIEQWEFYGCLMSTEEEIARIEQIKSADVMRAFRHSLKEKQVIVTLGPASKQQLFP